MATHTEQELAGLTEAERIALAELDQDEKDNDARHAAGEDDAVKAEADAAKKAEEDAAAAEAAAKEAEKKAESDKGKTAEELADEAAAVAKAADDAAKAEQAAKPDPFKPTPLFEAAPVENFDDQIKGIKDAKADITKRLEAGDLTYGEAEVEREKLHDQEMTLRLQQERYQMAESNRAQQEKNAWANACDSFMAEHAEYNTSKGRFTFLNETVKDLAKLPENANMTGPQLLAKAHEVVVADMGEVKGVAKTPADGKKSAEVPEISGIRNIPAAEKNETGENRFAYLDRLRGEAYEEAFAKLSSADRDAYMNQS